MISAACRPVGLPATLIRVGFSADREAVASLSSAHFRLYVGLPAVR
jgi:hypothetical protein